MAPRYPLHIHITTLFVILVLIVGGLIGWLGYRHSRDLLESTALELTERISRSTMGELNGIVAPAEMAINLARFEGVALARTIEARMQHVEFMRQALASSTAVSSLYVGYGNGDFFFVRRVVSDVERRAFDAPTSTAYIVQSIERDTVPARGRYIYLDAALETLRVDDRPDYARDYDPRTRPWFQRARSAAGQVKLPPYLFFSSGKVGTTLAVRTPSGDSVVGADILLETLGDALASQKVTPGSHVLLTSRKGEVLAYEDTSKLVRPPAQPGGDPVLARIDQLGVPALTPVLTPLADADPTASRHLRFRVDGEDWRATLAPVSFEGANPLYLITAIPDRELFAGALTIIRSSASVTMLIILLAIPATWLLARNISGSIRALAAEADAIRRFEFSQPLAVRSMIREVDELSATMASMKRTIRRFLDISLAVAAEYDFDRLLPRLLDETISAADADAGVLYLADQGQLVPAIARSREGRSIEGDFARFAEADRGTLLGAALAEGNARGGPLPGADVAVLRIEPVLAASGRDPHCIAVPLINRHRQTVGALLLLRHEAADAALVSFVEALSASAAVSLETKELIKAQKALFEAFIRLIAGAIDAKSPYTGGHCARVPELTKMLARAACAETTGPYKDFQLADEDWEAVHLAAWLHDCGKVTTPDYVVDKATKLETLYDRIHEVRMRFEVLKREAEIACLKAVAAGADAATENDKLALALKQIDDDFAFVARCNEGGEFMAPEMLGRLKAIAARTWMRTLDDRLGISHEEAERKARTLTRPLPAAEPLLADRPEHAIERRPQERIAADNPWGFRMAVPELLYNKGELHNLAVSRGTLSDEERYKINEHIVQTVVMLSQLPFPKHLRQVPEIAGGHHERMDGTGYPRRLRREDMSPVARMMAIADVFEALTSIDRPYKKGKTLSEAIRIMSSMTREGHLDAELFDLFLRSGVHRAYAERFLRPEQIDAVACG